MWGSEVPAKLDIKMPMDRSSPQTDDSLLHLEVFPLLAHPDRYVACGLDLGEDESFRGYWLNLFRNHFPSLLDEAYRQATGWGEDPVEVRERNDAAAQLFYGHLDAVKAEPNRFGRLDILAICLERERVLRRCGIDDPYRQTKAKENEAAMKLLPSLLAELDQTPAQDLPRRLIEGVFAGNIFDLGVEATLELFKSGGIDFHAIRDKLKPRPWLIDDLDRWVDRLLHHRPHRCAVIFVDNAGCDIVLGIIPLTRYLLNRGTGVILTANSTPSLNDITHDELTGLIESVCSWEPVLRDAVNDGSLELIPSGNGAPLIDLTRCSRSLVDAVRQRGVDLVVLEGMGRALESNHHAPFTCDVLKIAMIKDLGVAGAIGGQVYDLVIKFEPGGDGR